MSIVFDGSTEIACQKFKLVTLFFSTFILHPIQTFTAQLHQHVTLTCFELGVLRQHHQVL